MSVSAPSRIHSTPVCLIIDDDPSFLGMASEVVRLEGASVVTASTLADARARLLAGRVDMVLLDNHLPDGLGYEFHEDLVRRRPDLPVVMITGMPDLEQAVALTRNGLFDYLTKPLSADDLGACLRRVAARLQSGDSGIVEMVGDSPAMCRVRDDLRRAAAHPGGTVLITGETGTGKDLAARVLHRLTHPSGGAPYVALNCAAVPSDMFEGELFGAERGAYTGADRRREGLVGAADGGTLFLDEVGEIPLMLQAKLLRLLEDGEFRALGAVAVRRFSGRIVAATNRALSHEVAAGRFREDLMYRLDVLTVELPPLRGRREDIPSLAAALLAQLAERYGRTVPRLRPEDESRLLAHAFPGNVRELRNILERSLLRTGPGSRWLVLDDRGLGGGGSRSGAGVAGPGEDRETPDPEPAADRDLTPLEAEEYRLIRETLAATRGGIRRTAAVLGLSPQALLRRLEKWPELRPPRT